MVSLNTTNAKWGTIPQPEVANILEPLPQKPPGYIQNSKTLRLTTQSLKTIFEPTILAIEDLVRAQYEANAALGNKPFDYIFLVGGFGSSQLLYKHLETKFVDKGRADGTKKVIQPLSPGMAIINGAVLLGKDASLIRMRKMRSTYGIGAVVEYEEGKHREDKKTTLQDKTGNWCKDVLDIFVSKGQEVDESKVEVRTYKPQAANQRFMSLSLFITPLSKVTYVDEPSVKKLGDIIIDMTDISGGLNRSVEVRMSFGKTEIQVTAIESTSQNLYKASLKFDSSLLDYTGPTPKNYHIIFINDTSGSMAIQGAKPSLSWMIHQNNLGALYEACHSFLETRAGCKDIVSCILYNDKAVTHFQHQPVDPEALTREMMKVAADGNTHFGNAMKQLEVLLDSSPITHIPVAIFMTDGLCGDDGATETLRNIMTKHGPSGLTFHSVLFHSVLFHSVLFHSVLFNIVASEGESPETLLKLMAEIGNGTMNFSKITLEDMKKTYMVLAALLE